MNDTDDWDPLWDIHRYWGTHPKLEQRPGYLIQGFCHAATNELYRELKKVVHASYGDMRWMLASLVMGAGERDWKRWDLL